MKKNFFALSLVALALCAGGWSMDPLAQNPPATEPAPTPPAPTPPATPPAPTPPPTPPAPKLATVEKGSLTLTADRAGRIASSKKTIVRFELEAFSGQVTVQSVRAVAGLVKAGMVIAELKGKDFDKALIDLRTQLAEATEKLSLLQEEQKITRAADATQLERTERSLFLADQRLKIARDYSFARDLDMAAMRMKSQIDGLRDQGDELSQLERMYSDTTLESETKDIVIGRARRSMERGQKSLQYGQKDYDLFLSVEHPNTVHEAEDNLKYAQQSLEHLRIRQRLQTISARLALAGAERGIEETKLRLSRMENDAKAMTVTAPISGLMSLNIPDVGEPVSGRSVLATIVDPMTLEINGTLDVSSQRVIEAGSQVEVWIPSRPESTGTAVVEEISPLGSPDGDGASYPFTAAVRTQDGVWPLGAEARIVARKVIADCILVDSKAIKCEKGKWTVQLWIDGKKVERDIRIGANDGTKTQVLAGISVGDQVVMPDA